MMNINISKTVGLFLLAALTAVPAFAVPGNGQKERGFKGQGPRCEQRQGKQFHKGGHGHQMHKGMKDPAMMLIHAGDKIGLSDEQEVKLFKLSQGRRDEVKKHHEAVKPVREKMRALHQSDTFDEKALRTVADEMHELKTDAMIREASYRNQVQSILTNEQKAKLDEMKKTLKCKMENRMGKAKGMRKGKGQRPGPCPVQPEEVE